METEWLFSKPALQGNVLILVGGPFSDSHTETILQESGRLE